MNLATSHVMAEEIIHKGHVHASTSVRALDRPGQDVLAVDHWAEGVGADIVVPDDDAVDGAGKESAHLVLVFEYRGPVEVQTVRVDVDAAAGAVTVQAWNANDILAGERDLAQQYVDVVVNPL